MTPDDTRDDSGPPPPSPVDDDWHPDRDVALAGVRRICVTCRYDLRGLSPEVDRCPECGNSFDRHAHEIPVRAGGGALGITLAVFGVAVGLMGLCAGQSTFGLCILGGPILGLIVALHGGPPTRLVITDVGIRLRDGDPCVPWSDVRGASHAGGQLRVAAARHGRRVTRLRCRLIGASGVGGDDLVHAIDERRRRSIDARLGTCLLTLDARLRQRQLFIARRPGGIVLELVLLWGAIAVGIVVFLFPADAAHQGLVVLGVIGGAGGLIPVCMVCARGLHPITIRVGREGIDIDASQPEAMDGFLPWREIELIDIRRGPTLRLRRPPFMRRRRLHFRLRADADQVARLETLIRQHHRAARDEPSTPIPADARWDTLSA
ncbi:MAG: hypothetical protein KDA25_07705 [Phycisphaerales bacterium]|nr:hypothetical protein [Phycisphaerales bacterium]